jgi:hypothetical protein
LESITRRGLAAVRTSLVCGSLYVIITPYAGKCLEFEINAKFRMRRAPADIHFTPALHTRRAVSRTETDIWLVMAQTHEGESLLNRRAKLSHIDHSASSSHVIHPIQGGWRIPKIF